MFIFLRSTNLSIYHARQKKVIVNRGHDQPSYPCNPTKSFADLITKSLDPVICIASVKSGYPHNIVLLLQENLCFGYSLEVPH